MDGVRSWCSCTSGVWTAGTDLLAELLQRRPTRPRRSRSRSAACRRSPRYGSPTGQPRTSFTIHTDVAAVDRDRGAVDQVADRPLSQLREAPLGAAAPLLQGAMHHQVLPQL